MQMIDQPLAVNRGFPAGGAGGFPVRQAAPGGAAPQDMLAALQAQMAGQAGFPGGGAQAAPPASPVGMPLAASPFEQVYRAQQEEAAARQPGAPGAQGGYAALLEQLKQYMTQRGGGFGRQAPASPYDPSVYNEAETVHHFVPGTGFVGNIGRTESVHAQQAALRALKAANPGMRTSTEIMRDFRGPALAARAKMLPQQTASPYASNRQALAARFNRQAM